ncbi:MAG: type II secretion system protein [Gammaproteobacteria bacterium]
MNRLLLSKNRGFSLIELTVVLLAGIALHSTSEMSFQVRYEQTQERLQRIKEAIIGNPSRTINGQPDISGFVTDMWRLPLNIHELLERRYCSDDRTKDYSDPTCLKPIEQPSYGPDITYNSGLYYGWNGPYLTV